MTSTKADQVVKDPVEKWWQDGKHRLVLGVFQGGGAKGIAYAGALRAVKSEGMWFSQVAGSSAGAITAALIAAGIHTDEIAAVTRTALSRVRSPTVKLAAGLSQGVFTNRPLGAWLDDELRGRLKVPSDRRSPVTFAELETASGIACHVVVLNLAKGTPMVFCGALTPNVAVVDAVLASSAIPGGLDPGRAVIDGPRGRRVVHHLVDGGAWSNFPTFVFRDAGWREWAFGAGSGAPRPNPPEWSTVAWPSVSETLDAELCGFTINCATEPPPTASLHCLFRRDYQRYPQFDLGAGRSVDSYVASAMSWVLGAHILRSIALFATVALAIVLFGQIPEATLDWSELLLGPGAIEPFHPLLFTTGATAILAGTVAAICFPLGLFLFGRILAFSVMPSIRAATGVATKAPPWVRAMPNSIVVNLDVPPPVKTTSFRLEPTLQDEVIKAAESQALVQLKKVAPCPMDQKADRPVRPARTGRQAPVGSGAVGSQNVRVRPATNAAEPEPAGVAGRLRGTLALPMRALGRGHRALVAVATWHWAASVALGIGAAAAFSYLVMVSAQQGSAPIGLGAAVLAAVGLGVTGAALHTKAKERAAGRAVGRRRDHVKIAAGVVLLVVISVVAGSFVDHANDSARVTAARGEGDRSPVSYAATLSDGEEASFESEVHLRVGEDVRLERNGNTGQTWELAGVPRGVLFVIASTSGVLAFALLMIGADEWWYARFRRAVERSLHS